jgi:hypothetical protein
MTGPLLRLLPRRSVSLRATVAISALLFFSVLAGSVTIQAQRIEGQHRLDGVRTELESAEQINRALRAEVAIAESPQRVKAEAVRMGMVEPGPVLPLASVSTQPGGPQEGSR